jgi:hypothetical protein
MFSIKKKLEIKNKNHLIEIFKYIKKDKICGITKYEFV